MITSAVRQNFRFPLKVSELVASLILIWPNTFENSCFVLFFNLTFFTVSFIHITNIDSSFVVYLGYLLFII